MSKGRVLAVVGAQFGSEGKGSIVHHIADYYDVHVRTGGPNAGHSFWHQGKKWVMQIIPCGWTNPEAFMVLGRGMLINPKMLLDEIAMLQEADPDIRKRIRIDSKAGCLDPKFHDQEGGVNGAIHQRIGSTGEGVGAARVARTNRDPEKFQLIGQVAKEWGIEDMMFDNTPKFLRDAIDDGKSVLLEGTQGSGLSLIHGPWPYCTSTDTNAAQMAADTGLPPQMITNVMLVARTFPIRVFGNSGPLKGEMTWEQISARMGKPTLERTTVTKKVRRIGEWDEELMDNAVILNAPTSIALTFADYLDPNMAEKTDLRDLTGEVLSFIGYIESRWDVPVSFIGTGGQDCIIARRATW